MALLLLCVSWLVLIGVTAGETGVDALLRRLSVPGIDDNFVSYLADYFFRHSVRKTALFIYKSERDVTHVRLNRENIVHVIFNEHNGKMFDPAKMDYPGHFVFVNVDLKKAMPLLQGIRFDRVVVSDWNCSSLHAYFKGCLKNDMTQAFGICMARDRIQLYTFEPFDGDRCDDPGRLLLLLEIDMKTEAVEVHRTIRSVPYPDYNGCPIKIKAVHRPPAIYEGLRHLVKGYEVEILNQTMMRLNATLQYDVVLEMFKNVRMRKYLKHDSEIVAGMLTAFTNLEPSEVMVFCGGGTTISMVVPIITRQSLVSAALSLIASSFPTTTWYIVSGVIIFNIFFYYAAQNIVFKDKIAFIRAVEMGNNLVAGRFPLPRRLTYSTRIQFAFWWFFVIFMSTFFSAGLKSRLTVGDSGSEIRDLRDVARLNLKIVTTGRNYKNIVKRMIEIDPETVTLNETVIIVPGIPGMMQTLTRIANRKDAVLIEKKEFLEFLMSTLDYSDLSKIYLSDKLTSKLATAFYTRKQTPFLRLLEEKCMGMIESGIADRLKRRYEWRNTQKLLQILEKENSRELEQPLRITDILGAVSILGIGYLIAFITFILERTVHQWKN